MPTRRCRRPRRPREARLRRCGRSRVVGQRRRKEPDLVARWGPSFRWTTAAVAVAVAVAVLVLGAADAFAGAWAQPAQQLYLRAGGKAYFAGQHFATTGERVPGDWWDHQSAFRDLGLNLYAEYGI